MTTLDPRIEAIRVKYGLDRSDFWELPQKKGTWIVKHAALEIVATKANIIWGVPQILEANGGEGIAAMVVTGTLGERTEWATGEATPKNNKNAYPWAMAEKRGKDRVVLKLSGIAGLVFSEDEADDFKEPIAPKPKDAPQSAEIDYVAQLSKAMNLDDAKAVFELAWKSTTILDKRAAFKSAYDAKKDELATPNFKGIK